MTERTFSLGKGGILLTAWETGWIVDFLGSNRRKLGGKEQRIGSA